MTLSARTPTPRLRQTKSFGALPFGQALKRRRQSMRITLDEMSRRTGFSASALSDLENGRKLTFPKANAVCIALGVRLSVMVAESEGHAALTHPSARPTTRS